MPQPAAAMLLTSRECAIVRLIAEGWSSKQIGRHLGIAAGTVRRHRNNLHRRLGLHSAAALVHWWSLHQAHYQTATMDVPSEV